MRILICSFIFFAFGFTVISTVFDFSITTIDGEDVSFAKYQGKKILIVVLPSTHTSEDSLLLQSMDTMSLRYKDSLTIIGIPSYEDDYLDDSLQSLSAWYKSLAGDSVVLAQGMNTRKNSAYQTDLFGWLTDKNLNGHFDNDVEGAGAKYFITEGGSLYAVIGPDAPLNDELMQMILQ